MNCPKCGNSLKAYGNTANYETEYYCLKCQGPVADPVFKSPSKIDLLTPEEEKRYQEYRNMGTLALAAIIEEQQAKLEGYKAQNDVYGEENLILKGKLEAALEVCRDIINLDQETDLGIVSSGVTRIADKARKVVEEIK